MCVYARERKRMRERDRDREREGGGMEVLVFKILKMFGWSLGFGVWSLGRLYVCMWGECVCLGCSLSLSLSLSLLSLSFVLYVCLSLHPPPSSLTFLFHTTTTSTSTSVCFSCNYLHLIITYQTQINFKIYILVPVNYFNLF